MRSVIEGKLVCYACPPRQELSAPLLEAGSKGVLLLEPDGPQKPIIKGTTVRARYTKSSAVCKNNCDVVFLGGSSSFALRKRSFFQRYETIGLPVAIGSAASIYGLLRYAISKKLVFKGLLSSPEDQLPPLLIFNNKLSTRNRQPRLYGPASKSALEILRDIKHIDYTLLRWLQEIEEDGEVSDIDMLISHTSLPVLKEYLKKEIGLFPIDVFADNGEDGYCYKGIPYLPTPLAQRLLKETQLSGKGIKIFTPRANYTAFAFHLLFHKSAIIAPGATELDPLLWGDQKYYNELLRLAGDAEITTPKTLDDLETFLKSAKAFPPLDSIGFYSQGNDFLKARYLSQDELGGTTTTVFIIRDFDLTIEDVTAITVMIEKKGFEVITSRRLSKAQRKHATENIRGGNWYDKKAKGGLAVPAHLLICIDPHPQKTRGKAKRRYPRLDNQRILVKRDIRKWIGKQRGTGDLNIIHASDNTIEAMEYILEIDPTLTPLKSGK